MKKSQLDKLVEKTREGIRKSLVVRKGRFDTSEDGVAAKHVPIVKYHKQEKAEGKVLEFQKMSDDLYLTSTILGKKPQELRLFKQFTNLFEDESELAKAMATGSSGSGSQWIPTDFSSQLIEEVKTERRLPAAFMSMDMPSNPFKIPGKSDTSTSRLASSENTAVSGSNPTTVNVTLDAVKLMTYIQISTEMSEDAVVAILPILRKDIVDSLVDAEENAIINGDNSGTHMDSDVTDSSDQRKAWKGLRKHAIEQSYTRDLSTFNADNLALMKSDMGKYGVDPNKLVWCFGPVGYAKLLTLKDSQNNPVLITLDKVGPKATILTGQVGILFGSPVIVSDQVRENLNASGYYDGSTTSYTVCFLARRDGFIVGNRRNVTVKQKEEPTTDSLDIVASVRKDFEPRYAIASNQVVTLGIKIS
jgi:HK97 family phage major capsid protein